MNLDPRVQEKIVVEVTGPEVHGKVGLEARSTVITGDLIKGMSYELFGEKLDTCLMHNIVSAKVHFVLMVSQNKRY